MVKRQVYECCKCGGPNGLTHSECGYCGHSFHPKDDVSQTASLEEKTDKTRTKRTRLERIPWTKVHLGETYRTTVRLLSQVDAHTCEIRPGDSDIRLLKHRGRYGSGFYIPKTDEYISCDLSHDMMKYLLDLKRKDIDAEVQLEYQEVLYGDEIVGYAAIKVDQRPSGSEQLEWLRAK